MAIYSGSTFTPDGINIPTRGGDYERIKPEYRPDDSLIEAVFRQENIIGSAVTKASYGLFNEWERDAGFEPLEYARSIGRKDMFKTIAHAKSPDHADAMIAYAEKQQRDREHIGQYGFWQNLPGMLAANVVDPVNLLPAAHVIKGATKGATVVKTMLASSALVSAGVSTQEALLHATQTERTIMESAFATATGAALGGMFGGILGKNAAKVQTFIGDEVDSAPKTKSVDTGTATAVDDYKEATRKSEAETRGMGGREHESKTIYKGVEIDPGAASVANGDLKAVVNPQTSEVTVEYPKAPPNVKGRDIRYDPEADRYYDQPKKGKRAGQVVEWETQKEATVVDLETKSAKSVAVQIEEDFFIDVEGIKWERNKDGVMVKKKNVEGKRKVVLSYYSKDGIRLTYSRKRGYRVHKKDKWKLDEKFELPRVVVDPETGNMRPKTAEDDRRIKLAATAALFNDVSGTGYGGWKYIHDGKTSRVVATKVEDGRPLAIYFDAEGNPMGGNSKKGLSTHIIGGSADDSGIAYLNKGWKKYMIRALDSVTGLTKSFLLSGLNSNSKHVRGFTSMMLDHSMMLGRNIKGKSSFIPLETRLQLDKAKKYNVIKKVIGVWEDSVGIGDSKSATINAANRLRQNLSGTKTLDQFSDEVGVELVNPGGNNDPFVQKAAKLIRDELVDVASKLRGLGLVTEDLSVEYINKYMARRPDLLKIMEDEDGLRDVLIEHFKQKHRGSQPAEWVYNEAQAVIDKWKVGGDELVMSDMLARLATDGGSITKERVLDIDPAKLHPWMESNALEVFNEYMDMASKAIRFKEVLLEGNVKHLGDITAGIKKEYLEKLNNVAGDVKTKGEGLGWSKDKILKEIQKQQVKVRKEMNTEVKQVGDLAAHMLGQYRKKVHGEKIFHYVSDFLNVSMLQNVVISSLSEPAMTTLRHADNGKWQHEFFKSFVHIKNDIIKLNQKEADDLFLALSMDAEHIYKNMEGLADNTPASKKHIGDKIWDLATRGAMEATGIGLWTRNGQNAAAHSALSSVSRRAVEFVEGAKLTRKEKNLYSQMGVSEADLVDIAEMVKKYGRKQGYAYAPRMELWSNKFVRDKMMAMARREVNANVLVSDMGSNPINAQRNSALNLLFKFKSFPALATGRILIPTIQTGMAGNYKDMFTGLMALGFLGMVAEAIHATRRGENFTDKFEDEDKFAELVYDGFNRAGIFAMIGDPLSIVGRMLAGDRYAHRRIDGLVFGPVLSMLNTVSGVANDVVQGDITDKTKENVKRITPFAGLWWLNSNIYKGMAGENKG